MNLISMQVKVFMKFNDKYIYKNYSTVENDRQLI